jgi:hypothetical protein
MNNTLCEASKFHGVRNIVHKLSSLGAPTHLVSPSNRGEGSTFSSIPTKRAAVPSKSSRRSKTPSEVPDTHYLDFKRSLLPRLLHATTPAPETDALSGSRRSSEISNVSPLLPSEHHWFLINQLRIHAGGPERTEKGIEILMNYYAQLCWLEERFPFETEEVGTVFAWNEAFYQDKRIETTCIQYEKAAVMFNIGAIYSQLGTTQSLWSHDGLKRAAKYFQLAAGAFLHARDNLVPRFKAKLDASSDLSDLTLSAASDLMLAQSIECYYLKAEDDNTSSPVTSQIAAQCSDYYDSAYKSSKLNNSLGKQRFPKSWTAQMAAKHLVYLACAHYHCPNYREPAAVVGERHGRLMLAKSFAQKAIEKCTAKDSNISPELTVYLSSVLEKIQRSLDEIDRANFDTFNQVLVKKESLHPLRRPARSLVSRIDPVFGAEPGTVCDLVSNGQITDIFSDVVGMLCMNSGSVSVFRRQSATIFDSRRPSKTTTETSYDTQVKVLKSSEKNSRSNSLQSLMNAMDSPKTRRASNFRGNNAGSLDLSSLSPMILEEIKKFVWDVKKTSDHWSTELSSWKEHCAFPTNDDYVMISEKCASLGTLNDTSNLLQRGHKLLRAYQACLELDENSSTLSLFEKIQNSDKEILMILNQAHKRLWGGGESLKAIMQRRNSNHLVNPSDIPQYRLSIQALLNQWLVEESNNDQLDPATDSFKLQDIKHCVAEISDEAKTEGFLELFPTMEKNENGSNDLYWSLNKIKTVIPCLEETWDRECKDEVLRFLDLCKELNIDSRISGFKLDVVTDKLLASVDNYVHETSIALSELEDAQSRLNAFKDQWFENESTTLSFRPSGNSNIIEELVKLGKTELSLRGYGSKPQLQEMIAAGLSCGRKELEVLANSFKNLCEGLKQKIPLIKNISSFRSELNSSLRNLNNHVAVFKESDRIISAFEEQLIKWKQWRKSADRLGNQLVLTKEKLHQTFGPFIEETNERVLHNNTEKLDASVSDMLCQQEALTKKQIHQSFEIAKQTEREYVHNEHLFQHALNGMHTPSTPRRQEAMRRLSVTASAISRNTKFLEQKLNNQDYIEPEVLARTKQELKNQLLALQNQQREFAKLHDDHLQWINNGTPYEVKSVSRKVNVLDKVKNKLSTILSRRPSHETAKVPTAPVLPQPDVRLLEENSKLKHKLETTQRKLSQAEDLVKRRKSIPRKPLPTEYPETPARERAVRSSMASESDVAYQIKRMSISCKSRKEGRKYSNVSEPEIQPQDSVSRRPSKNYTSLQAQGVPPLRKISFKVPSNEHQEDAQDGKFDLRQEMEDISKYFAWNRSPYSINAHRI